MSTLGARKLGWTALFLWASVGMGLEAMHAFKVPGYLDDELARLLLRLGHAHGALLAIVLIVASAEVERRPTRHAGWILRSLGFAALTMPTGFFFSAFAHPEGDPGWPIFLVPVGGASLLVGLAFAAVAAWRPSSPGSDAGDEDRGA